MNPLQLAVVGHTNTGKTSLMRTLLRDSRFGEVNNAAATTRYVEQADLICNGQTLVQLYDTPGLEDAGGVLDWLENETSRQADGIERIRHFLDSSAAQTEFSQEAKVLRQLANSDAAVYVIDARESVLPKYRDELTILSWCAKPLMPVFNFTQNCDISAWQEMLVRRGLHVSSRFDTVAFDFEGEMRLWHNLAVMLPPNDTLSQLTTARRQNWDALNTQAKQAVARFLLDVAAFKQSYDAANQPETIQAAMQDKVRQHERALHRQLLSLYRFYQDDWDSQADWVAKSFRQDPFNPELLKTYGIRTGTGIATGVLIGLGLDAVTLGTSLGLGSAIGGVLGGLVSNWQSLSDKINSIRTLHIDDCTITLLAARSLDLLHVIQMRGHASTHPISLQKPVMPWSNTHFPDVLKKARNYPKWSALNGSVSDFSDTHWQAVQELTALLNDVFRLPEKD